MVLEYMNCHNDPELKRQSKKEKYTVTGKEKILGSTVNKERYANLSQSISMNKVHL